jgi:hypothetical protein
MSLTIGSVLDPKRQLRIVALTLSNGASLGTVAGFRPATVALVDMLLDFALAARPARAEVPS